MAVSETIGRNREAVKDSSACPGSTRLPFQRLPFRHQPVLIRAMRVTDYTAKRYEILSILNDATLSNQGDRLHPREHGRASLGPEAQRATLARCCKQNGIELRGVSRTSASPARPTSTAAQGSSPRSAR
jgi:hypothetical protein